MIYRTKGWEDKEYLTYLGSWSIGLQNCIQQNHQINITL